MDFGELAAMAWELMRDHWAKVLGPLAGLLFGWWWGRRRAKREWSKKQFLHRLNISLNVLEDPPPRQSNSAAPDEKIALPTLRIRTLLEEEAERVLLNPIAVERMIAAANRTTEHDPLLPLSDEDAWHLLNAVLNEISEKFSLGHVKRDLGMPVESGRYLIALTNEVAGELRTRKVRAMVIKKEKLLALTDQCPNLENPRHKTRFETLRRLAASYHERPGQFLEVEISV